MFWFFVIAALVIGIVIASSAEKTKEKARLAYVEALEKLKANPTNSDLRQSTLALGRSYANMMRDNKGHTTFDEVALMNDINAACANALAPLSPVRSAPPSSVEERLLKLQSLRESGLISEEDYQARKREILEQI